MSRNVQNTENYTGGPYVLPSNGDRGEAEVFDVLETFLERLATHSHTGQDSTSLTLNIEKDIAEFTNGVDLSWILVSTDRFRAEIVVAENKSYDETIRKYFVLDPLTNEYKEWYPEVEKATNTSYYIYTNDNTISLRIITL